MQRPPQVPPLVSVLLLVCTLLLSLLLPHDAAPGSATSPLPLLTDPETLLPSLALLVLLLIG